jgi:hypothetical protein
VTDLTDALMRVHAELMGKATENRIIADHIKARYPDTIDHGVLWRHHDEAARAYTIAAARIFKSDRIEPTPSAEDAGGVLV